MNLLKKTPKNTIGTHMVDTELSTFIDERSTFFHEKHTHETVQKLSALKFKELPKNTSISQLIGEMKSDFQGLIERINQRCNRTLQKSRSKASIENSGEKEQALSQQIQESDRQLSIAKSKSSDKGKEHKAEVMMWYYIRFFLVLIAGAEFAGNYNVFASIGGGLISNIGLSLLAAISIYFYAHFTPEKVDYYSKGDIRKQILYYILYFIPIIVVFYGFSVLRIQYINALNDDVQFNTNPLVIVTINAFAYAISYWLVKRYKPTKDKILAYKKYKHNLKDIRDLEKHRSTLVEQQNAIAPELREELGDRLSVMLLGKMLENEVVSHYESCFNAFKVELFVNTSGACASFFTGDIDTDLSKLKLYFQDIDENYNPQH